MFFYVISVSTSVVIITGDCNSI